MKRHLFCVAVVAAILAWVVAAPLSSAQTKSQPDDSRSKKRPVPDAKTPTTPSNPAIDSLRPEKFVIKDIFPEPPGRQGDTRVWVKEQGQGSWRLALSAGFQEGSPLDFRGDPLSNDEHLFEGKVTLRGYSFESEASYPLTFKLVSSIGYLRLCGSGVVTDKDGRTHRLGYEETVANWLPLMNSQDRYDREGAAQALGWLARLPNEKALAIPALIKALTDSVMEVRRDAVEAIGKLNDPKAADAVFGVLKDRDEWVVRVSAEALQQSLASGLSATNVSQLLKETDGRDKKVRIRAINVLGFTRNPAAVDRLEQHLSDSDVEVRAAAAKAMGATADARAKSLLVRLLDDSAYQVRVGAASGLGYLRDKDAVEPLIELLKKRAGERRQLRTMEQRMWWNGHKEMAAAAEALGVIGDPRAIQPLRELLEEKVQLLNVTEPVKKALKKLEQ